VYIVYFEDMKKKLKFNFEFVVFNGGAYIVMVMITGET